MSRYKYTEDNPLKVFTAFSGYVANAWLSTVSASRMSLSDGARSMTMPSAHTMHCIRSMPIETSGISSRLIGSKYLILTCLLFRAHARTGQRPDSREVVQRVLAHVHPSCGNAVKPFLRRSRDTSCLRMSRRSSARSSSLISTSGYRSLKVMDTPTIGRS